jgi:sec-independent protein translocase protein TatB
VIAIVAVVVIGPKDLPKAMADLAGWIRKLRGLATDFRGQVNDMVKGTELEEVAKAAKGLNRYNVTRQFGNTIDPQGQIRKALEETRAAANARVAIPAATPATPPVASSSGLVEAGQPAADAAPALAVEAVERESGAAIAANPAAVRAMTGEPAGRD